MRCGACSTRPASNTRSTRRSCAASTTTRARSSPSPPRGSARSRRSAAAGRYDGLVAELGGPDTAAIGWAAGIERILLALGETEETAERSDVFVAVAEPEQRQAALALANELRHAGLVANLDLAGRSLKGQLKQADRAGARHTVILEGEGRATIRDMESGDQREVDVAQLPDELAGAR